MNKSQNKNENIKTTENQSNHITRLVGVGAADDSFGRFRGLLTIVGVKHWSKKLGLAAWEIGVTAAADWEVDGDGWLVGGATTGALKVVKGCPPSVKTIKSGAIRSKKSRLAAA